MIFSPANNTEYLIVAAYLEAFWGYIWPALCHNNEPELEHWTVPKHGGLKEFVDEVISTIGRVQIKPAIECPEVWQHILQEIKGKADTR